MNVCFKIFQGLVVGALFILLPVVGEPGMYAMPQPWIMLGIGVLATLFQPRYDPFKKAPNPAEKGSTAHVIWSIYLLQVLTMLEAAYLRYPAGMQWTLMTTVVLVVMLAGLVLRSWSVLVLGGCFSWYLKADPNQPVIQSGPYRWIRHPSYTGALMTYLAAPLLFGSWFAFIAAWIFLPLIYIRRVRIEEDLLVRALGLPYETYRQRTWKIIPVLY